MSLTSRLALVSRLGAASLALSAAVFLPSCGGGGGGGDLAFQPAPQTLHALALQLDPGGIQYVFIRDTGDTTLGEVEEGGVVVRRDAPAFSVADEFGIITDVKPSNEVSQATYTYERVSPESAVITITGDGSGVDSKGDAANYYSETPFTRRYEILFATDGAIITAINVDDYTVTDGITFDILWNNATIKTYAGGDVPVGYSITRSNFEEIPTLYPESIDGEFLRIIPDVGDEKTLSVLSSTYTRFINDTDFTEEGVANLKDPAGSSAVVVNYKYEPVSGTANLATFTIVFEDREEVYNFKFLDEESGTYT
ncbi:MAG: hypothetical protein R3242_03595, partial [Akkermansiaceae bacterium]|nr:hypothetical protein [Akkermansiaceae bacterium]